MSDGQACTCSGTRTQRMTAWVVRVRGGNYSAFNGYRFTPSAYSEVTCDDCGGRWRTAAAYVDSLPTRPYANEHYTTDDVCPDDPDGLHHIGCGCDR